jgi:uncharacterized protein (DUF305 family)
MKTNPVLIGVVALLIGFGIGHVSGAWGGMKHMKPEGSGMHSAMSDMTGGLEGKEGAEFEQAFLKEMIVHHEGAVAMAQMVLQKSQRPELIKLANDIIAAQTTEITQMREWQNSWFGTTATPSSNDMAEPGSAVHHAQ